MNKKIAELHDMLTPSPRMPVLFVGHGNPMNAILDNTITRTWSEVGRNLPSPQALVVISAHWLTRGTHITDAVKQPLIYDMYGFPDELYKTTYPAHGSPELAALLQKQFLQYEAVLDSSWGLDHGTWSVLKHLAPNPTVPVLQISLDMTQSLSQMVEMLKQLQPLRNKGVIFIGSGNIVHNLRMLNFHTNAVFDWAEEFDDSVAGHIANRDVDLLARPEKISAIAKYAVPTDDHYRPMLAAMALSSPIDELTFFNATIEMGSIGMRSFMLA